jgi:hypothetical protein
MAIKGIQQPSLQVLKQQQTGHLWPGHANTVLLHCATEWGVAQATHHSFYTQFVHSGSFLLAGYPVVD